MKVYAIALNTFKEAVRNRILYVLLFFAALILLAAWVASTLAIAGQEKIVRDLGVAAINMISVLIAVFVGTTVVYNDLDKKTIYTIVSKPISRWHYLVGKYFGLLLTICINVLLMTFFFLVVLNFRSLTDSELMTKTIFLDASGDPREVAAATVWMYYLKSLLVSIWDSLVCVVTLGMVSTSSTAGVMVVSFLTMMEMAVLTAFSILFSSFSSPILSAFMTVFIFLIGRANEDLMDFARVLVLRSGGAGKEALTASQKFAYEGCQVLAHVLPNLSCFDQRGAIGTMVAPSISGYSTAYCFVYSGAVLALAALIFNRRNFK